MDCVALLFHLCHNSGYLKSMASLAVISLRLEVHESQYCTCHFPQPRPAALIMSAAYSHQLPLQPTLGVVGGIWYFFCNSINRRRKMRRRNQRHDTCIHDPQVRCPVHFQITVYHAANLPRLHCRSAGRMEHRRRIGLYEGAPLIVRLYHRAGCQFRR